MSDVSITQLRAIFPKIDPAYMAPINETLNKYAITTKVRKACFLAQTGHESVMFMRFEENLNYSAEGLRATFPKYFASVAAAQPYARNPQKIANMVYANRMGNGAPGTNDGWSYRGRGAIQITGKDNYTRLAHDFNMTLPDTVAFLMTPRGAVMSAGWFWNGEHLNQYADNSDMKTITQRINGGLNGYDARMKLFNAGMAVL
jgi:putative chitinase